MEKYIIYVLNYMRMEKMAKCPMIWQSQDRLEKFTPFVPNKKANVFS